MGVYECGCMGEGVHVNGGEYMIGKLYTANAIEPGVNTLTLITPAPS